MREMYSPRLRKFIPRLLVTVLSLAYARVANAHGPFGFALVEQIQNVQEPATVRELNLKFSRTVGVDLWSGGCAVCHLGGRGGTPRNVFGNALNTFLSYTDYNTPGRISEAGRRVMDIPANPTLPDSPTFGEILRAGELPVPIFSRTAPIVRRTNPAPPAERFGVEEARKRVKQVEAESRFGILQLSKLDEMSPEVAAALAEFRGEFLILGVRSLSSEVAAELSKSRAGTVWLHSVTRVSPAAAESIVKLRGQLVLTGLAELTSTALAEKLAARPGALSFPYLTEITPDIAAALIKHDGSLTLGGLVSVPLQVQDILAEATGAVNLPSLKSLDSMALTKKLAESWRTFIPDVERLTAEQAELFANSKGQKFLSSAAMTDEVAALFSRSMKATSIVLFGNAPLSDTAFRALLNTRYSGLELRDVEDPTPGQVKIMTEAKRTAFYPQLKKLDSVPVALALGPSATYPNVTLISPEVADALGRLPEGTRKERDGTTMSIPSGSLSFPSLEDLPPETARLLLKRRWLGLSFPALQDYSVEMVRAMARQTPSLTLGLTSLPPELAAAFTDIPNHPGGNLAGLTLPYLSDLSPESARILVKGLNRGVEVQGKIRITKTPGLSIGGTFGSAAAGISKLSPELATELAKFEGVLTISGIRELSPQSAAPLASFPGPYLRLSGPGTERLNPETAASLAKVPGRLILEGLKVIDSAPLCDKNTGVATWYWNRAEIVAPETVPALIRFRQWFNLDGLTVLDSTALAKRLIDPPLTSGGRNLHALQHLTPEAAAVLATFDRPLRLGLSVLDDPEVARALAQTKGKIELKRLKAATPEVIAILRAAESIEVPDLNSLYILPAVTK